MTESDRRRDLEQAEGGEPVAPDPDQEAVRRETERAGREAGSIGGDPGSEPVDEEGRPVPEAERPLAEGGEGVAEGFEQAEASLVESAEHGEDRPADRDAFPAEADEDRATHGEPDTPVSDET
jgi:hypothetical protein